VPASDRGDLDGWGMSKLIKQKPSNFVEENFLLAVIAGVVFVLSS